MKDLTPVGPVVASAARTVWTPTPPPRASLSAQLMLPVPVPYRKSLSWNTLRARKRAEAKEVSTMGVRGQENGLLRKTKETTPPPPLASPVTGVKGKVSTPAAHAGDVCAHTCLPFLFFLFLNLRAPGCVCAYPQIL